MAVTVRNHPELIANLRDYNGIAAFTDGSIPAVLPYLIPYTVETGNSKEAKAAWANRRARLYNVNELAPALAIHAGHLAQKTAIDGLPEDEQIKAIQADVTGYGQNAVEFSREILELYMRDGRVGVLVDRSAAVADTAAEAKASGERSYQVLYEAKQIRSWKYFTAGPRKGLLSEVILDEPSWFDERGTEYAQLRRYTLEESGNFKYELLRAKDKNGLPLDPNAPNKEVLYDIVPDQSFDGALEYIPFYIWGCGPRESYLREIWELNAARMNLSSIKSNINYNQGFQRNAAAGAKPAELEKAGESLIWILSNENAKFFTIQAGDPAAIEKEEAVLKNEINRRRKFEFNQLADDTRQQQSAESKEKDMVARIGIYDQTLDTLEMLLVKIWTAHLDYEGKSGAAVKVKIERDYGLDDELATSLELHTTFAEAQTIGAREVQKAVIRTRISKLRLIPKDGQSDDDLRKELFDDIEAAEPETLGSALSGLSAARRPSLGEVVQ